MKQWLKFLLLVILSMSALNEARAAAHPKPLPADQAFQLTVTPRSQDRLQAQWQIAPGYYLYRERFAFDFLPKTTVDIQMPKGHLKLRDGGRQEEVYANSVTIPLVLHGKAGNVQLKVSYQGCSDYGFCYPPTTKTFTLALSGTGQAAAGNKSFSLTALLTNQNNVKTLFESQSLFMTLLIFLGIGLLLAFTPCVFPMIPILTSIIVGQKQPASTRKAFFLSLTYVFGTAVTYALAGLAAAYLGRSLQVSLQQPWIIVLLSSIFMLLALSLFGVFELRLPNRWQNAVMTLSRQQQGGTYLGVFMMGLVSTLIVSPCVTAPLIGVLMYIADAGNPVFGASALFVMSLGMGIPLILIGVSAGKWLPKSGSWMVIIQKIFGLLLVGMAVWLLSRITLPIITLIFCMACLIAGGLYHWLTAELEQPTAYHQFGLTISLAAIVLAGILGIPYVNVHATSYKTSISSPSSFKLVKNLDDISQALLMAKAAGKPVMLDFYADWCESCVVMDENVFNKPDVMESLSSFVKLRADLSQNNANDEAILKHYEVIAPPTVLFFNTQGQEVNTYRIIGELDANEFMTRIHTFFTAKCDKSLSC